MKAVKLALLPYYKHITSIAPIIISSVSDETYSFSNIQYNSLVLSCDNGKGRGPETSI